MKTQNRETILNALYNAEYHIRMAENEVHDVLPHGQPIELTPKDMEEIRHVVYLIFRDHMNVLTEWLVNLAAETFATREN